MLIALKLLKLRTSNLTCVFSGSVRTKIQGHILLFTMHSLRYLGLLHPVKVSRNQMVCVLFIRIGSQLAKLHAVAGILFRTVFPRSFKVVSE